MKPMHPSSVTATSRVDHGLPERTVTAISQGLGEQVRQRLGVQLHGSRAMGPHRRGSHIDRAISPPFP